MIRIRTLVPAAGLAAFAALSLAAVPANATMAPASGKTTTAAKDHKQVKVSKHRKTKTSTSSSSTAKAPNAG